MRKHKYSKDFLERINPANPETSKDESEEVKTAPAEVKEKDVDPAIYTHKALAMYKLKENVQARFVLVEIPFNPETGEVGNIKELCRDIREDVIDKFKIEVDNNGYFRNEG